MIFVDTSAIYALADRADANHARAVTCFAELLASGATLLTHSYVLVEATTLLQRRLGLAVALRFADEVRAFEIEWVTQSQHEAALEMLRHSGKRRVSLVDEVSFLVMAGRGVRAAFAFDDDFTARGFESLAR